MALPFPPRTDGLVTIRPPTADDGPILRAGPGFPAPLPAACIVVGGRVVGWIDYETDGPWLGPDEVDVSYTVFEADRRRGYASRGLELLIAHLSQDTPYVKATLLIDPTVEESLGVARRCSFAAVGEVDGFLLFERAIER